MSKQRIGVYPGTFDPITLGHMDIIRRGAKLVDKLVIGVTTNIAKSPMFSDEERLDMVRRECAGIDADIVVIGFNSLLMDRRSLNVLFGRIGQQIRCLLEKLASFIQR